jgi:glucokinase-like ROK family protein
LPSFPGPARDTTGRNLSDIRLINRAVIFRTIRDAGMISRADLARSSGLNPATVTHIVRELLHQGLVEEAGFARSSGGRRSELLRIRPQHSYVIAVSLGRRSIEGMLTDLEMREVTRKRLASISLASPADITLPALLDMIRGLIAHAGVERERLAGIGICAPGPLDAHRGLILNPPNFPSWKFTPLKEIVEAETGLPTLVDNDANAAALAEKWFGAARGIDNFIYILGESGVGCGIVISGDIFRGAHDVAGEVGHTTIDLNGLPCDCGNTGCLELYASPAAAEQQVVRAIAAGSRTKVLELANGNPDRVSYELIIQAAQEGDALARSTLNAMSEALGAGVVNLVNAFDPEAIILGGRLALAGDPLLNRLREVVARCTMANDLRQVRVLQSALHTDAPVIGAFSLVLRELFLHGGSLDAAALRALQPSAPASVLLSASPAEP